MNDEFLDYLDDMGVEIEDSLIRFGKNKEMYFEYLIKFFEDSNIILLRTAVAEKDADTAMTAVHTLKGVALNLGLLPVADVCMDMIIDFRAGNVSSAFSKMDELNRTLDEWTKIINRINE